MKKLFISILISFATMQGMTQVSTVQGPTTTQSQVVVSVGTFTTKSGEILPVYKGSKGGLYCFRTSGKTGLPYKQYLKAEQVTGLTN